MQNKFRNLTLIFCIFLFAQQFISCKKDNTVNISTGIYSNDDLSIQKLPVDSSLVAWYPFSKAKLKDKSYYNNRIVFSSATPAISKHGDDSSAYYFNGTSSYMKIKNSASLNPASAITLAALVKPMGFYNGKCHGNRILFKGVDGNTPGQYLIGFDDALSYNYTQCDKSVKTNRENFYASYGNGAQSSGANDTTHYIKPDQWYTIVYTYDGTNSKIYVNNKLINSVQLTTTFTPQGTDLYIGKAPHAYYPYYFNGVIDEIRIYNRALSEDEVLGLNDVMGNDE